MATVTQDSATILRLRTGIGAVGIALPFVLTIGNALQVGEPVLLTSISGAYYTGMRDVFVGSMCAIGVFLIFYRYQRADDILGTIAGLAAIVLALFPTKPGVDSLLMGISDSPKGITHGIASAVLFLSMAIFCFFLFPRSATPGALTPRKKARNVTYVVCGILIILGLGVAALGSQLLPATAVDTVRPFFWGEAVAVVSFGVAWLAKSNTILRDVES
ncbi:MAG: DUF998 domain-containing protein [Hamadaea sp.]|nr:DUF998 domain-containing protein [Hamadaea sp.]